MKVKVYKVHAFAETKKGGNEAGIVLDGDSLTESQMQEIAKRAGYSETAFINNSKKADYNIRFFTPNKEVNLCGHATIAIFSLLKSLNIINSGEFLIQTKAGLIEINIDNSSNVFMKQPKPLFFEKVENSFILDCFNIDKGSIIKDLPIQIVSTGLKDILLPIKNLDILLSMEPNFDKISQISREYNVIGVHAFTLETINNATAHGRNFAPLYDIPEESATGTSNGALAGYLYKYGKISEAYKILQFEQGYIMNKPSAILAKIKNNYVYIGGKAILAEPPYITVSFNM